MPIFHTLSLWRLWLTLIRAPCIVKPAMHTLISDKNSILSSTGQVVPSSESDPTLSYSLAKTILFDVFFQVFLQQEGKKKKQLVFGMAIEPEAW